MSTMAFKQAIGMPLHFSFDKLSSAPDLTDKIDAKNKLGTTQICLIAEASSSQVDLLRSPQPECLVQMIAFASESSGLGAECGNCSMLPISLARTRSWP